MDLGAIASLIDAPGVASQVAEALLGSVSQLFGQAGVLDFAAQADAGNGNQYRGAVGNAVAAYLQTKGMIDQAKILADFGDTLESIAALFWLFSAALALGAFAVFGSYRQGLYFLIGPPLFFYMITATVPTTGTELRFGKHVVPLAKGEQSELLQYIRAINADTGETRNVSLFFGLWDSIVSEAVHEVVALLVNTDNKDHLRFVARERMLNFVLHSSPDHQGFIRMIGAVHYGECAHLMPAQQRSHVLKKAPPVRHSNFEGAQTADTKFKDQWVQPGMPLDTESKSFLLAFKKAGVEGFADVPFDDVTEQYSPSCEDIWGFIKSASRHMAERQMTKEAFFGLFRGDTSEIPWDAVVDDIKEYFANFLTGGRSADAKARDMLGAYIYKNALERTSVAALTSQAFSRTPFNASEFEDVNGVLAKTEAHGGFMQLKYFAQAVPYIQGFLLYLLGIAFPFFAIFLVIPSRAMSFFAWMGMWAWVKSWDVGFAAVHAARDVLWYMLRGRVNVHGEDLNWDDPMSVISVIYNNDPFYGENTYWLIVSMMTISIPFITAHAFLGATGLFGMFSGTIDQTSGRFARVERERSRRFVANVNEHLQRIGHDRFARAYSLAGQNQKGMTGEERAAMVQGLKDGKLNYDEGATTADGKPLADAEYKGKEDDISAARKRHAQGHYELGRMLGMVGTEGFNDNLAMSRMNAIRKGEADPTRGTVPLDSPVAPPLKDADGNNVYDAQGNQQFDMSSMQMYLGDTETANQLAQQGITWGEMAEMSTSNQLNNQAFTAAITGRRMLNPTRFNHSAENFMKIQTQQMQYMRDISSGAEVNNVDGGAEALGTDRRGLSNPAESSEVPDK